MYKAATFACSEHCSCQSMFSETKTCTEEISFHFFKSYLVAQAVSDGGKSRQ